MDSAVPQGKCRKLHHEHIKDGFSKVGDFVVVEYLRWNRVFNKWVREAEHFRPRAHIVTVTNEPCSFWELHSISHVWSTDNAGRM